MSRKRSFFLRAVPEEILQEPDPRLREKCSSVQGMNKEVQQSIDTMVVALKKLDSWWHPFRIFNTLGLAAPQIGYSTRIFILRRWFRVYDTYINPEIVERHFLFPIIESCLSVKTWHIVWRYMWVTIQYQTMENTLAKRSFFGPQAVLVQQEIDHLNGKLISDYGN